MSGLNISRWFIIGPIADERKLILNRLLDGFVELHPRSLLFFLSIALAFGVRFRLENKNFEQQCRIFPEPSRKGSFRVWVAEEPEILFDRQSGSRETGRQGGFYQEGVGEVRAVCGLLSADGKPMDPGIPARVRCSFQLSSGAEPVLSYGDEVEVEGKIMAPPRALNPGQFDYKRFLRNRGVAYVLYASPGKWRKIPGAGTAHHGNFLSAWSCGLRREMEDRVDRFLPYPENALLTGILLGERGPLPGKTVESFLVTGTVHILAVSGMITAFVSGLFFLFLRTLQMGRKTAAFFSLIALGFFVLVTGAHPPVCRAGLFSGLALGAVLLERKVRGGTILLATAVLLAAWNPRVLEDLSFQISFLATAGLMVLAGRIAEKISFLWKPAALLIATTAAAQASVWCLLIYTFNQLSPYSVAANLAVVPLAFFSVAAGLVMILGSFLHPFLGNVTGAACGVSLRLLTVFADQVSHWPRADFILASPPGGWVLAYHLILLSVFFFYWPLEKPEAPSAEWKKKRSFFLQGQKITGILFAGFLSASAAVWFWKHCQTQPLKIVFLSVGHGNAVVVRSPAGRVFVCDGGKEAKGSDRYQILVAYLRHEGITRVESLLDSHPDEDHVGGLVNLAGAYPVQRAYEGIGAKSDSRIYRDFKEVLSDKKIPIRGLKAGDRLSDLEPAGLSIFHPPEFFQPRLHADNNRSVVSWITLPTALGPFSLLLPGDLEKDGLRELLKNHRPFPPVDWLMAPHHGRKSGEPALCAEGFKPRFVVLSDWKDYPEDRSLYRSQVPDSVVLSTALEGAIEVRIDAGGMGRYRSFLNPEWKTFEEGEGHLLPNVDRAVK